MKRILAIIIVSVLTLITSISFPQSLPESRDNTVSPYWDYYSLNYLSVVNAGKGNTGAASTGDISSSIINPASLSPGNKYQAVFSYGIKTECDLYPDDDFRQIHPSFSAGAAIKILKDFSAGIIYSNNRNVNYTVYSGTSDLVQVFNEHLFSVPVSYENGIIRAGIGLNFRLMHGSIKGLISSVNYPDGAYTYGKTDRIFFNPDFGFVITPLENLSFGAAFSPAGEFNNEWVYDTLFGNKTTTSRFPMKLTAGTELRFPREGLKFSFDYTFEKMSDYAGYENRNNINFGAEYNPTKDLTLRAGFFTLNTESTRRWFTHDSDNPFFLTAGLSYIYKVIKFNAAVLSSSLIEKSDVSHTIINFGAVYEF